ncbi:hypothetical protein [Streptomyces sp. WAC04114]|uniref:zinc finger domain-containing protein n=1 Tax=Streptomyces sp. WAC04114 TaxID=2867961 RepID=UPI001C8BE8ED|nr:hypothetical protein [Streptomyces sp. WAC04114]MBX9365575.1 hypothetical protein [Streptomyces sp. WAC04114]
MPDTSPDLPPFHVYAMAHRCSTCGAEPGLPCEAPRKEAAYDARANIRQRTGRPQLPWDPSQLIHASRDDAGRRHRDRDELAAPWPKDREPGRRYDTLGEHWQSPAESA